MSVFLCPSLCLVGAHRQSKDEKGRDGGVGRRLPKREAALLEGAVCRRVGKGEGWSLVL